MFCLWLLVLYTDQGKINAMLEELFGIKTGFLGKLVSNLARMRLADVVDDANDKHMQPWADLCAVRAMFSLDREEWDNELALIQHAHSLIVDDGTTGARDPQHAAHAVH